MNDLKEKSHYLSLKKIAFLTLIISVGYHLIFLAFLFFGKTLFIATDSDSHPLPRIMFMRFLFNVLRTYILVFILFLYHRRKMSKTFSTSRKLFFTIAAGSLLITISYVFLAFFADFVVLKREMPTTLDRMFLDMLIRNTLLALIVTLTSLLIKSITDQRDVFIENETLKTENLKGRFEALKNQMDPHFMFNSLNTLQSLISIDTDKAEEYLQKLSYVLRYSMQSKEVVRLGEELQYLQDYCHMMKMRYNENLKFNIEINPNLNDYLILPLTLQGLVENAIKHNVVSSKKPLTITIKLADNEAIVVSNNVQPKLEKEKSNGIGLANLLERYRLKWEKEIVIRNDGSLFEVEVPLVKELSRDIVTSD